LEGDDEGNMLDDSYWIDKEGNKLYPQDIEDIYLMNIINFMEKNAEIYQNAEIEEIISLGVPPDGGSGCGEDQFVEYLNYVSNLEPLEWVRETVTYQTMLDEMKSRGLCFSQKRVGLK
jgi:hypothetical protein